MRLPKQTRAASRDGTGCVMVEKQLEPGPRLIGLVFVRSFSLSLYLLLNRNALWLTREPYFSSLARSLSRLGAKRNLGSNSNCSCCWCSSRASEREGSISARKHSIDLTDHWSVLLKFQIYHVQMPHRSGDLQLGRINHASSSAANASCYPIVCLPFRA